LGWPILPPIAAIIVVVFCIKPYLKTWKASFNY
jgi:hypothetical protein